MPYRTKWLRLIPWKGGTNTSLDPSMLQPGEVVAAWDVVWSTDNARNMRDGINFNWDSSSAFGGTNGEGIVGLCDFWYLTSSANATTKTNFLMGLGSSGNLYQWNKTTGARTFIPLNSTATAWNSNIFTGKCVFEVMNNALIYTSDVFGNVPRQYIPLQSSSATDLSGSPPQASLLREWQGRLWTNDKTTQDRLNYSPPGDFQTWGGVGDSGALDLGPGDGDPVGLTAIFPAFQGGEGSLVSLYVAKQTKLYKVTGFTPETYQVTPVSDGIGCVSHTAAVAIDQDDVVFVSEKGIHSLLGTIQYGDVKDKYLSRKIQKTINKFWTRTSLKNVWGCYLSQINSVAFAIPDTQFTGNGNTAIQNTAIWLYNFVEEAWYVWPYIDCQSIAASYDTDEKRMYIGTGTGRVAKAFNGTNYDISVTGAQTLITMTVKTGFIFPENNPLTVNAFKKFALFWGPQGTVNVTVSFQIDNDTPQSLSFIETGVNNVLGVSFVLGVSALGFSSQTLPFIQSIDGYGRGFQITLTQNGQQAAVNIQGFAVEYEPTGPQEETQTTG